MTALGFNETLSALCYYWVQDKLLGKLRLGSTHSADLDFSACIDSSRQSLPSSQNRLQLLHNSFELCAGDSSIHDKRMINPAASRLLLWVVSENNDLLRESIFRIKYSLSKGNILQLHKIVKTSCQTILSAEESTCHQVNTLMIPPGMAHNKSWYRLLPNQKFKRWSQGIIVFAACVWKSCPDLPSLRYFFLAAGVEWEDHRPYQEEF